MYRLKEGMYAKLKKEYPNLRLKNLAEKVGIKGTFISLIFNRRRTCSKMTAFCISKFINSNYEIEDLFVNEKGE